MPKKKCEKIRFTRGKNQLNCSNPAGIFQAYSLFLIGTFMHTCGHSLPCPCQWWRGAHLQMESGLCRSPAASRERKAPGACWAWTQPTRFAGKDVQIKQKIGKIHMKCLQNMYICLSMYPSIFLSVCLAVWFFVRFVHTSIHLSIYLCYTFLHMFVRPCAAQVFIENNPFSLLLKVPLRLKTKVRFQFWGNRNWPILFSIDPFEKTIKKWRSGLRVSSLNNKN